MKSEYYKSTIVILLFCFFSAGLYGQNDNVRNHVSVRKNQLNIVKGSNVVIDFDILLNGVEVSSNRQLVLIPVIKNANKRIELPPVVVNGKKRANLYKRSLALDGKRTDLYSQIKADKKTVFEKISYKTTIPYEPWMKKASVYLIEDLCGCGGAGEEYVKALIANGIDYVEFRGNFVPSVNFIIPAKEEIKKRDEHGEAYIIFEMAKWDILPQLYNNKHELEKIRNSLQYVREEPTTQITSVSIKAYASPEASSDYNLNLSEKRADALADYVRTLYNVPTGILTAEGKGEAWSDLERVVSADSKIEHKSEVLRIIRSNSAFDEKEKQLKGIAGGSTWSYMLNNLFPRLRRSDYRIEYTVPHYTIEKGKELLKSKPNMLSLEEMYRIAYSYEEGSKLFNEVFLQAVKSFPDDKIAILNAATADILAGNFQKAKEILVQYESDPDAWNSLGLVYMYQNNFQQARYYLEKARDHGLNNADENLHSLEKVKEQYKTYLQEKADFEYK
jgi:tetratricopeptide (TPR) repeat protein